MSSFSLHYLGNNNLFALLFDSSLLFEKWPDIIEYEYLID